MLFAVIDSRHCCADPYSANIKGRQVGYVVWGEKPGGCVLLEQRITGRQSFPRAEKGSFTVGGNADLNRFACLDPVRCKFVDKGMVADPYTTNQVSSELILIGVVIAVRRARRSSKD